MIFAPAKKTLDRKEACSVSISCRARTLAIGRKPSLARIGAEIEGVRLSGELPDATIEGIHAALLRHKVLFFRRHNHLTDDQQEIVLWSCPHPGRVAAILPVTTESARDRSNPVFIQLRDEILSLLGVSAHQ